MLQSLNFCNVKLNSNFFFFNLEAYLSSNLNNLLFIHISCKEKMLFLSLTEPFKKAETLEVRI